MWFEVPMGNSLHQLFVDEAHKIHTTYGGATLEAYLTMNIILENSRHNLDHIKKLNIEHTIQKILLLAKSTRCLTQELQPASATMNFFNSS